MGAGETADLFPEETVLESAVKRRRWPVSLKLQRHCPGRNAVSSGVVWNGVAVWVCVGVSSQKAKNVVGCANFDCPTKVARYSGSFSLHTEACNDDASGCCNEGAFSLPCRVGIVDKFVERVRSSVIRTMPRECADTLALSSNVRAPSFLFQEYLRFVVTSTPHTSWVTVSWASVASVVSMASLKSTLTFCAHAVAAYKPPLLWRCVRWSGPLEQTAAKSACSCGESAWVRLTAAGRGRRCCRHIEACVHACVCAQRRRVSQRPPLTRLRDDARAFSTRPPRIKTLARVGS